MNMTLKILTVLLIFSTSAGCITVGPDYSQPDTGIAIPETYQNGTSLSSDALNQWWKAFKDDKLDSMIEEALKNNLDIKKAAARILEMQALGVQAQADKSPVLNIQTQAVRQDPSKNLFPTGKKTDTLTVSLPASYELDLWGKLAKAEAAAKADILNSQENRRTIIQTVIAEVVNNYLTIESLERRIQIRKQSIRNYRTSLEMVDNRYKRGLSSILDVQQARRTLANAEAGLPSLLQDIGINQQKLAVILGRYPETSALRTQPEDYFLFYEKMTPVPSGLPSELMKRRPDIKAAEASLQALNARVGVAKARRFPGITLTGAFGYSSGELHNLMDPQSELWNLAFGIIQPIYDAGNKKAAQNAAEARYEQGLAEYTKTILQAFSEVENALLIRKKQIERRALSLIFLKEAITTQKTAQDRYNRGLVDYLTVLEAQQISFQAEENLILTELAILTNRVFLYRALGGDWEER